MLITPARACPAGVLYENDPGRHEPTGVFAFVECAVNKTLAEILAVGCGGFLGALLRFGVARIFGSANPVGTFVINISGSLFLGWFLTVIGERVIVSDWVRLGIATGFVGAYTTFSTYMYEADGLLQKGLEWRPLLVSISYLAGSVVLGLVAVRTGIILGKRL